MVSDIPAEDGNVANLFLHCTGTLTYISRQTWWELFPVGMIMRHRENFINAFMKRFREDDLASLERF